MDCQISAPKPGSIYPKIFMQCVKASNSDAKTSDHWISILRYTLPVVKVAIYAVAMWCLIVVVHTFFAVNSHCKWFLFWPEPLRHGNPPAHAEGARRHLQSRRGLAALVFAERHFVDHVVDHRRVEPAPDDFILAQI